MKPPQKTILILVIILVLIGIVGYVIINQEKWASKNDKGSLMPPIECYKDVYNCADFETQEQAQEVLDFCGDNDIHRLDSDGNGVACESLQGE